MDTIDVDPPELARLMARFAEGWPPILEASAGWYSLLADLDRTLATIAPDYVVTQIKSKCGALRFYAEPSERPYEYIAEFQDAIAAAERRSSETCEHCGAPAKQYAIRGWVSTLCQRHRDEFITLGPDPH